MALSLPPLPGPGPTQSDVISAIRPGSGVTVDSPGPDVVRDLAISAEALRVVVGGIRAGLLTLESVVAAIGTGDLSAITAQLADKASVASVTALAQSVAQLVDDSGDFARVGQIPTTPGEVGADPAGAAQSVRNLVTSTYATNTNLSDGLAGKINVATYNAKIAALEAADAAQVIAIAAKYIKPTTGIPETDLASAVAAKLTLSANAITQGQLDDSIAGIVGSVPTRLITLAELAGAVGNDDEIAGSLNGILATKYTKPAGGIPATDLSAALRDLFVTIAANASAVTSLQAQVDQLVTPPSSPPTALVLTGSAGDGQVTISRTGGEGIGVLYALYRGTTATGTPIATRFPFTDTGLINGTAVSYTATASNNLGTVTSSTITRTPSGVVLPTARAVFRASAITGVAEGEKVASVPTGVSGGPAWVQADTTVQPTYRASYNGRPAIFCSGGWLATASGISYSGVGFVVARVWFPSTPSSTTDRTVIAADLGTSSGSTRLWHLAGAAGGLGKTRAWSSGGIVRVDTVAGAEGGKWLLMASRWGNGQVESYIDGVTDGATAGSTTPGTSSIPVIIGAGYTSPSLSEVATAYVSEARVYYQAVSNDEVQAIFADMA